jgi:hypothetical protein
METLNGKTLTDFRLRDALVRIVDMVNFDGPLVTLFQNIHNKHLYLFDWVEKDKDFNRWIIYRCNPKMLNKFIRGNASHYELYISDEATCFKVDIDTHLRWFNLVEVNKNDLPTSYIPARDDFFEKCDCPNFIKLEQFINQEMESQKQENLIINPSPSIKTEWIYKYAPKTTTGDEAIPNSFWKKRLKMPITEYPVDMSDIEHFLSNIKYNKLHYVQSNH